MYENATRKQLIYTLIKNVTNVKYTIQWLFAYLHNCTITTSNVQILLLVFKNGIIWLKHMGTLEIKFIL